MRAVTNGNKVSVGWHDTDLDVELHRIVPRHEPFAPGVIERHTPPAPPVWPVAVGLVGAIAAFVVMISGVAL